MRPLSQPLARLPLGAFCCILVWFLWMLAQGSSSVICTEFDFRSPDVERSLPEQPAYSQLQAYLQELDAVHQKACVYLDSGASYQELLSLVQLAKDHDWQLKVEGERLMISR